MSTIMPGTLARVRLHPDWLGDGRRPHHPAEDTCRVQVTVVDRTDNGDHVVFALFKGGRQNTLPTPPGGLGIGRYFRPDALRVQLGFQRLLPEQTVRRQGIRAVDRQRFGIRDRQFLGHLSTVLVPSRRPGLVDLNDALAL